MWQLFSEPTLSSRLCLTLLHSIWQVTLFALTARAVGRLWRRRSVERDYGFHVVALVASLVAMPVTFASVSVARPRAAEGLTFRAPAGVVSIRIGPSAESLSLSRRDAHARFCNEFDPIRRLSVARRPPGIFLGVARAVDCRSVWGWSCADAGAARRGRLASEQAGPSGTDSSRRASCRTRPSDGSTMVDVGCSRARASGRNLHSESGWTRLAEDSRAGIGTDRLVGASSWK